MQTSLARLLWLLKCNIENYDLAVKRGKYVDKMVFKLYTAQNFLLFRTIPPMVDNRAQVDETACTYAQIQNLSGAHIPVWENLDENGFAIRWRDDGYKDHSDVALVEEVKNISAPVPPEKFKVPVVPSVNDLTKMLGLQL